MLRRGIEFRVVSIFCSQFISLDEICNGNIRRILSVSSQVILANEACGLFILHMYASSCHSEIIYFALGLLSHYSNARNSVKTALCSDVTLEMSQPSASISSIVSFTRARMSSTRRVSRIFCMIRAEI